MKKIILTYKFNTAIWDILYFMNTFYFHQKQTYFIKKTLSIQLKRIISKKNLDLTVSRFIIFSGISTAIWKEFPYLYLHTATSISNRRIQ